MAAREISALTLVKVIEAQIIFEECCNIKVLVMSIVKSTEGKRRSKQVKIIKFKAVLR
jgi:hypothetical protein